MKKVIIHLIFAFSLLSSIKADTFIETNYINRGVWDSNDMFGPFISDYNKNGKDELVISSTAQVVLFYEYNNGFNLLDSIPFDTNYEYLIPVGISDLDTDGLSEITLIKTGSNRLWVYEQSESTSFFDSLVWQSDTVYKSICHVGITNKLKGDGVDRIYGGGIPWLTTTTKSYGWYYFTCTGDNHHEILNTFEESTRVSSAMDIGNINGNGLTDVVITSPENYLYFYESEDLADTNFMKYDSITEGGYASGALLILPDIDRDGFNEIMKYQLNYAGYPTSYGFLIYEDASGVGIYDTIFNRDFEVETDNMVLFAGDINYGDVDGDSIEEVVFCGGRHLEVWEATGDNMFTMLWEYTDPTYNTIQSHIKCHDFNKNGYDEIIFSGVGSSLGEEHTRIFEDSVAVNGIEESRELWDSTCTVPTNSGTALVLSQMQIIWNTNTQGTLTVYDISGREVIREETKATGEYKTDIGHLKNGIYFIKLQTPNQLITEKMVRIR